MGAWYGSKPTSGLCSLAELSAQYERERTQHASQVATWRRQVEHLGGR